MAELKTQPTDASVDAFIAGLDDARRDDCAVVLALMTEVTGLPAQMWGKAIVGFGRYDYTYASGRSGSWFRVGFSPRKRDLTLYVMPGFEKVQDLLEALGKHRLGKSCLYLKQLSDVDLDVLRQLVTRSLEVMEARYGPQA